jgi:hypothetical protein
MTQRTDGSVTISLRNVVGEGIIRSKGSNGESCKALRTIPKSQAGTKHLCFGRSKQKFDFQGHRSRSPVYSLGPLVSAQKVIFPPTS